MRDQKADHIIELLQKLLCDAVLTDVIAHTLLEAGMTPKLRIVIGIRQETYIEQQVCVLRNPMLEAEAEDRHLQVFISLLPLEDIRELSAQLLREQVRGIDDVVGLFLEPAHRLPLRLDAGFDATVLTERVRTPGLLEALDESLVRRVEIHDFIVDASADVPGVEHLLQQRQIAARAHIDPECRLRDLLMPVDDQLCKFIDQRNRQIIDAVVPHILEGLQCDRLAGATHPSHD